MMKRILSSNVADTVGQTITVAGWVHSRRDHGGLIFIDLRDHTGLVQLVINPEQAEAFRLAESLRDEFVIRASGVVTERGEGLKNPIQPYPEENQAGEDLRFKYRYLDLRRPKMQQMLKKRAEMYRCMHQYMDDRDFIEIQTPILANSSPEGARDFLIPSRLQENKFRELIDCTVSFISWI